MRPILTLVRKEFRQIFRTREMIAMLFIMPLIQTLILGFAVTNEVKHLRVLVADLDDTRSSRAMVRGFTTTDRFDVTGYTTDVNDITTAIREWKAQVGLVVPRGFQADLQRGLQPQVGLLVDAIDGNTAGVATGYAQSIVSGFAATVLPVGAASPYAVEERMWYNPGMDTASFMIPGLVAIVVTMVSMMMSSMALVKEKEIGTLEQLLVTPITRWQLLVGKLAPFLALTFVEMAFTLTAGSLVFGLHMAGSYWLLGALALVYLFTTLGLGIMVSTHTQTQQQAMFFSWFFMVFMILLSGLFIPIENMPSAIRAVTCLNPMRYFVAIMRDIVVKGATLGQLWRLVLPMAGFGAGIFLLAAATFHKRVK